MDWRIIAAGIAVLGVLAGGTLLTSQVQNDLEHGVDVRARNSGFEPPDDTPPLKLNEFKLPKDVPIDIPKGAKISPDLSKIELPKDMDISLPSDLDLSGLDFKLPEDFDLELPAGTVFSPPGLDLPKGGSIKLPDGTQMKLPPGSKLALPPEVVQRLLSEGVPVGALRDPRTIAMAGLGAGLLATLDPPSFDGGGKLSLPQGSVINLPPGTHVPFPPGDLPFDARYTLPTGTSFDIPVPQGRSGTFPVPIPNDPSQLEPTPGTSSAKIAVSTEITSMPSRVRKGERITVSGYVREAATGRPVVGAPVDIFMNESKKSPGVHVGSGTSDSSGNFNALLSLPEDRPARDYQLVNHAVAFRDSRGRQYADGWGDPPFATYASTSITLEVPARDGLGAQTLVTGVLTDHTSAPVGGVSVSVSVDGVVVGRPVTDSVGRFSLAHTFAAGFHTVEARFSGTPNYDASNIARGSITIDDYAIEIAELTLRGSPGDPFTFQGRTLGKGAIAPQRTVTITSPLLASPATLVSDSAGRFSTSIITPASQPPGRYTVRYAIPEYSVTKVQTIELNLTGRFAVNVPSTWDADVPLPVTVSLTSANGVPLPNQAVTMTLAGAGGAREFRTTTDGAGSIKMPVSPQRAAAGAYVLTVRSDGGPHVQIPTVTRTVTLGVFEVDWQLPETVVRGEDASGRAVVKFAGAPYAGAIVGLDFFAPSQVFTATDGSLTWTTKVPTRAPLGPVRVSISADDHPVRFANVTVVAVPKLSFSAPDSFEAGSQITPSITLTDDQGAPIKDAKVTILATGPDGVQRTNVTTDANGKWSAPINVTTGAGNVTLSARVEANGSYLGADAVRTASATAAPKFGDGLPKWLLPLLVGVTLAGATAGGAAWYIRKRPPRPRADPPAAAAAAAAAAPGIVARDADVSLSLGIPDTEPAVWGVGDPLAITIVNRGEAGEFELVWPGGSKSFGVGAGASEELDVAIPDEGQATIVVSRVGAPEMKPAQVEVRIVDYRKETAREFDLFLEKAKNLDGSLTKRTTPREIGWSLASRLGGDAERHLEEVALVMEVTNYSHYAVSREHYLRFVRASAALDVHFAPRLPGPPPAEGG